MTPGQITVPKQTWDDTLAALEEARNGLDWYQSEHPESKDGSDDEAMERIDAALAAAKAVRPYTDSTPELTVGESSFESWYANYERQGISKQVARDAYAAGMGDPLVNAVQPLGWYCVSRDGLATQFADQRDAEMTAKSANRDWPNSAPYRAVQLCEYVHPKASEPAPVAEFMPEVRSAKAAFESSTRLGFVYEYESYVAGYEQGQYDESMYLGPYDAPKGFKLVPVEPTPEMLYAIQDGCDILPPRGKRVWSAMLAAAPEAK